MFEQIKYAMIKPEGLILIFWSEHIDLAPFSTTCDVIVNQMLFCRVRPYCCLSCTGSADSVWLTRIRGTNVASADSTNALELA